MNSLSYNIAQQTMLKNEFDPIDKLYEVVKNLTFLERAGQRNLLAEQQLVQQINKDLFSTTDIGLAASFRTAYVIESSVVFSTVDYPPSWVEVRPDLQTRFPRPPHRAESFNAHKINGFLEGFYRGDELGNIGLGNQWYLVMQKDRGIYYIPVSTLGTGQTRVSIDNPKLTLVTV